jgi:hypothetical protein
MSTSNYVSRAGVTNQYRRLCNHLFCLHRATGGTQAPCRPTTLLWIALSPPPFARATVNHRYKHTTSISVERNALISRKPAQDIYVSVYATQAHVPRKPLYPVKHHTAISKNTRTDLSVLRVHRLQFRHGVHAGNIRPLDKARPEICPHTCLYRGKIATDNNK